MTYEELFNLIENNVLISEASKYQIAQLTEKCRNDIRMWPENVNNKNINVLYIPSDHSYDRNEGRLTSMELSSFLQYKLASTVFNIIKTKINNIGYYSCMLYFYGYKDNYAIALPYSILWDIDNEESPLVQITLKSIIPQPLNKASQPRTSYDEGEREKDMYFVAKNDVNIPKTYTFWLYPHNGSERLIDMCNVKLNNGRFIKISSSAKDITYPSDNIIFQLPSRQDNRFKRVN